MHPETLALIGRILFGAALILNAAWDPAAKRVCDDPWGLIRYRRYFATKLGKWHAALIGGLWLAAFSVAIWGLVVAKQLQKAGQV